MYPIGYVKSDEVKQVKCKRKTNMQLWNAFQHIQDTVTKFHRLIRWKIIY